MPDGRAPAPDVVAGAIAGAAGTLALNALTYADMALRGRAASTVPTDTVERLERLVGGGLAAGGVEAARNRREGVAALLGYATGVTFGVVYALVGRRLARLHPVVAGSAAGALAMAGANAGAVVAATTDPRQWGLEGWIADVVPHAGYGMVTAAVYGVVRRT